MLLLPLVILQFCTSFSQEAKEAFKTSFTFRFVPGVRGGNAVGTSAMKIKQIKHLLHVVNFFL